MCKVNGEEEMDRTKKTRRRRHYNGRGDEIRWRCQHRANNHIKTSKEVCVKSPYKSVNLRSLLATVAIYHLLLHPGGVKDSVLGLDIPAASVNFEAAFQGKCSRAASVAVVRANVGSKWGCRIEFESELESEAEKLNGG